LELINPALPNKYGQNWAASFVMNGTPWAAKFSFERQHRADYFRRSTFSTSSRGHPILSPSPREFWMSKITVWLLKHTIVWIERPFLW
jgi:hypothetical protein